MHHGDFRVEYDAGPAAYCTLVTKAIASKENAPRWKVEGTGERTCLVAEPQQANTFDLPVKM